MTRLIPAVLIALAAVLVPAASAKFPAPPAGSWDLHRTRTAYEGARAPRASLSNMIRSRVVFRPACTPHWCTVDVTVTTFGGRPITFRLAPSLAGYSGWVAIPTKLRCGARRLSAALTMTVNTVSPEGEPLAGITGTTEAFVANPGHCAMFHGKAWAMRQVWFEGVPAATSLWQ